MLSPLTVVLFIPSGTHSWRTMKHLLLSKFKSAWALLTPPVLALLAVLMFGATASAQPKDVAQLYAELKAIENQTAFPLPTPTTTLNVGRFDAAKNSFS